MIIRSKPNRLLRIFYVPILTPAPAAADTISAFLRETKMKPTDFDLIVTGDLGTHGAEMMRTVLMLDEIELGDIYNDCGAMIFDCEAQDVHAGGSGCGCSAVVLCSHILNEMRNRAINKVLFCGTGALLSPVSTSQGESIPAICHAVCIENSVAQ